MHVIAQIVQPEDIVFDIGANLGDKSAWFSNRGARVVCVEPQPALVAHLQQRFAGAPNVSVVGKGVGREPGVLTMSINRSAPVLSTFSQTWKTGRFSNHTWDEQVEVDITTMDDLISEYGSPAYIKIDVEGFEKNVVLGLSKKSGVISFEFTGEFIQEAIEITKLLAAKGYSEFNLSIGESDEFSSAAWLDIGVVCLTLEKSAAASETVWGDVYAR